MCQKLLKNVCFVIKIIWINFQPNARGVSAKDTTHNIAFQKCLKNGNHIFDFLSHDLLLAKLYAYGFSLSALKLIHNYWETEKKELKVI